MNNDCPRSPSTRLPPKPRLIAVASEAIAELMRFSGPADAVLSAYFRRHRLGPRERAFVAETAYAVLRRLRSLARWCGDDAPHHLVLAALVCERGFSPGTLTPALTAADAQWLAARRAQDKPQLSAAERCDLPDWLYDRLHSRYPEEALVALCRALHRPAPLDLRVNAWRTSRAEVLARFEQEGLRAEPCPYAPYGVRLLEKPALEKHPLFLSGLIEVQDEGSQLIVHLVAPRRGEMVVDFCAGAGGKTLALGALMRNTGRLYAFDVSPKRLAQLKPRLARAGLSNVHPIVLANENDIHVKRLAGKIDRVLVDAPCSGLGTLRRNPDLKWRMTPRDIEELTVKQAAILAAAARLVKPGGRLVYATCSLLAEENTAIVEAFLARHSGFRRLSAAEILAAQGIVVPGVATDLSLWPHLHGCDGFYAVAMERA